MLTYSVGFAQTADELVVQFEQSKGTQRLDLGNQLLRLMDQEEMTDSLIQYDSSTPADTVGAAVYYWMAVLKMAEAEFQEAIVYFERAKEVITPRQMVWYGDCESDLAICYARVGEFTSALSAAANAVELDEQLADKSRLLISLNTLGSVYVMAKQPLEGEKFVRRSLELAIELNDSLKMAARYGTMGEICQTAGRYAEAYDYTNKAFRLDSLRGDQMRMAVRRTQMANALSKEGKLEQASRLLRQANPVLREKGNIVSLSICLNQQGYVALMQEHWNEAADFYEQAYQIYVRTHDRNSKLTTLWGLWHAYCHIDASKALDYMEDYTALRDSVYQDDVTRVTADYNARYANHELTLQNEQARRDNRMLMLGGGVALLFLLGIVALLLYSLRLKSRTAQMQQQLRAARDRFFTNITHELRSPLTVINGATDTLMAHARDRNDEDDVELAQTLKHHSMTLLELINQMLDIARLSHVAGFENSAWRHGDVVEFISVMRESYEAYAASLGIALRYEHEEKEVMMDFVEDFLRKILRNLISNAVKFSEAGTTITITTRTEADRLLLSVRDEGRGMTADELEHVFVPFYQASSGDQQLGTGIGLPLVKLCAEAMQGSVSAESQPGKGSCFTVSLPLQHAGVAATSMPKAEMQPEQVELPLPRTELIDDELSDDSHTTRLLIVEDAPDVARYMSRLMPADYSVAFATDGVQALEKARQQMPDLIITDIMMPGMDGLQLCRQLRDDSLLCHIPVIMVTAKASPEDRLTGLQAGADAYMEKPFSADELKVRIENLLQQRQRLQQRYRAMIPVEEHAAQQPSADSQQNETEPMLRQHDVEFLERVDRQLRKQMQACNVDLELLASDLCITRLQLNRKMKALLGESMRDHVNRIRVERAIKLLSEGRLTISEVARACGIDDVAYFSRFFRKMTGQSPSEFRNG